MHLLKRGLFTLIASFALLVSCNNNLAEISNGASYVAITLDAGLFNFKTDEVATHTINVRKGYTWGKVTRSCSDEIKEKYIEGKDIDVAAGSTFQYWKSPKNVQIADDYKFETNTVLTANYSLGDIVVTISSETFEHEEIGHFVDPDSTTRTYNVKTGSKYSDVKYLFNEYPQPYDSSYTFQTFVKSDGSLIPSDFTFTSNTTFYSRYSKDSTPYKLSTDKWDVVINEANKGLENLKNVYREEYESEATPESPLYFWDDYYYQWWEITDKKPNTFVGLKKPIQFYSQKEEVTLTTFVTIIGENADYVSGTKIKTTLTFEFDRLIHPCKTYNFERTNNLYDSTTIYEYINGDLLKTLPSVIKDNLVNVSKPTHIGGGNGHNDNKYVMDFKENKLFIPSLAEKGYTGTNPSSYEPIEKEGLKDGDDFSTKPYAYYQNAGTPDPNKLIKTNFYDQVSPYWTRSPDVDTSAFVWSITSEGKISDTPTDVACGLGLDLCFCIGEDSSARQVRFHVNERDTGGYWIDEGGSPAGTNVVTITLDNDHTTFADAKNKLLSEEKLRPHRDEYRFTNWYDSTSGGNIINDNFEIITQVDVYANFATGESVSVDFTSNVPVNSWECSGEASASVGSNYTLQIEPKEIDVSQYSATAPKIRYKLPESINDFKITADDTILNNYCTYYKDGSVGKLIITSDGVDAAIGSTNGINISFNAKLESTPSLWDTVDLIAYGDEISNGIPGAVAKKYFRVGDLFPIAYDNSNEDNTYARLIGIVHDGDNDENSHYNALTFEFTNLVELTKYSENLTTSFNYNESKLKTQMDNMINKIGYSQHTSNGDLKNNIRQVSKPILTWNSSDGEVKVDNTNLYKFFPLSTYEMGGVSPINFVQYLDKKDGATYEYYKDCSSLYENEAMIKSTIESSNAVGLPYWTRTASYAEPNIYSTVFIYGDGSRGFISTKSSYAKYPLYCAPAFCL